MTNECPLCGNTVAGPFCQACAAGEEEEGKYWFFALPIKNMVWPITRPIQASYFPRDLPGASSGFFRVFRICYPSARLCGNVPPPYIPYGTVLTPTIDEQKTLHSGDVAGLVSLLAERTHYNLFTCKYIGRKWASQLALGDTRLVARVGRTYGHGEMALWSQPFVIWVDDQTEMVDVTDAVRSGRITGEPGKIL